jgi:cytochrome b561
VRWQADGRHWTWTATIIYGLALMIWIATQVSRIGFSSWLQPFHFALGVAFITLALTPSLRTHLAAVPTTAQAPH